MHVFNSIIFNLLASHKKVVIPDLGTFSVQQDEATLDDGTLTFPSNRINYSADIPEGTNLVDHIIAESGLERNDVEFALKRWVSDIRSVSEQGCIFIEGVCSVEKDKAGATVMVPCENLDKVLNPMEDEAIRLGKLQKKRLACNRRQKRRILWGGIVIAVFIGCLAVYLCRDRFNEIIFNVKNNRIEVDKGIAEVQAAQVVINTGAEAEATTEPGQTAESAIEPATVTAEPSGNNNTVVSSASGERYLLIAGVFSSQDNAARYIEGKKESMPFVWEIVPNAQGQFMVSASSFKDRGDAEREMARIRGSIPEVWIYRQPAK